MPGAAVRSVRSSNRGLRRYATGRRSASSSTTYHPLFEVRSKTSSALSGSDGGAVPAGGEPVESTRASSWLRASGEISAGWAACCCFCFLLLMASNANSWLLVAQCVPVHALTPTAAGTRHPLHRLVDVALRLDIDPVVYSPWSMYPFIGL